MNTRKCDLRHMLDSSYFRSLPLRDRGSRVVVFSSS